MFTVWNILKTILPFSSSKSFESLFSTWASLALDDSLLTRRALSIVTNEFANMVLAFQLLLTFALAMIDLATKACFRLLSTEARNILWLGTR